VGSEMCIRDSTDAPAAALTLASLLVANAATVIGFGVLALSPGVVPCIGRSAYFASLIHEPKGSPNRRQ